MFLAEGGYDRVAAKIFQSLNIKTYCLEYDTHRAGDFAALKHLPKDKNVVLGLVSTKSATLEDPEVLVARVYEAAKSIAKGNSQTTEEALKRLAVSPQCGFATVAAPVGYQEWAAMAAKLKLVQKVASQVWKEEGRGSDSML
jgi:methionine synthase II (cobalamin-independent)